jgi:hypothetical protein
MCPRRPARHHRLNQKRRTDVTTTATQAAQDMLERLNRAATLFGDADADPETAVADIPPGIGGK